MLLLPHTAGFLFGRSGHASVRSKRACMELPCCQCASQRRAHVCAIEFRPWCHLITQDSHNCPSSCPPPPTPELLHLSTAACCCCRLTCVCSRRSHGVSRPSWSARKRSSVHAMASWQQHSARPWQLLRPVTGWLQILRRCALRLQSCAPSWRRAGHSCTAMSR